MSIKAGQYFEIVNAGATGRHDTFDRVIGDVLYLKAFSSDGATVYIFRDEELVKKCNSESWYYGWFEDQLIAQSIKEINFIEHPNEDGWWVL